MRLVNSFWGLLLLIFVTSGCSTPNKVAENAPNSPVKREIAGIKPGHIEIVVQKGAADMMGPFAGWAVNSKGEHYGRVCSNLYALTDFKTNRVKTACKVCYGERFKTGNFPEANALGQLIPGEIISIESGWVGGGNDITENIGCSMKNGKPECSDEIFGVFGRTSKFNKEIQLICVGDSEIERATLEVLFKNTFQFRQVQ